MGFFFLITVWLFKPLLTEKQLTTGMQNLKNVSSIKVKNIQMDF